MKKIPILMYHHIYESAACLKPHERPYAVSADCFKDHLNALVSRDVKTIVPGDQSKRCRNCVMITFDDGYLDNFTHAFPALIAKGLYAIFFVIAGRVGREGYMDALQLRRMAEAGMMIGSHGLTHQFFNDHSDDVLMSELIESRKILQEAVGQPVTMLSLPGGRMHPRLMHYAPLAGYEHVFTSDPSCYTLKNTSQGTAENQELCQKYPRIPIRSCQNQDVFERIITADPLFYLRQRFVFALKQIGKNFLGDSNYRKLYNHQSRRKKIC